MSFFQIGFDKPAYSLPIPVITGTLTGLAVGYFIYRGANAMSINIFFSIMTTLLFFISAGLFTTSVHAFLEVTGGKEVVLWNLNCCNEDTNRGWEIANALFGWRHTATLDTTLAYIAYWIAVFVALIVIHYRD